MIAEGTLASSRQSTAMRVEAKSTEAEFMALRGPWNALAGRCPSASVFLMHEWFAAAWAWRKQRATLLVLCAYAESALSGVLPLIVEQATESAMPLRRLEFLTVPDTQFCDLIVAPGQIEEVTKAFAAELARRGGQWDVMRLEYLGESADAARALRSALAALGFHSETCDAGRNLSIALAAGWDEYYATRSRSLKKANNLAANRLKKAGQIRVDWIEPGTGDARTVEHMLDTMIEVSRRSWKQETGNSLDHPGPQAFIRELSAAAWQRGWLSMWVIYVDDKALAMEYQLVFDGRVHALRADFDAECTDISPGSFLFRHLLEMLCKRGLGSYYMGPGENPYKMRWSEQGDSQQRVLVYGKTLRGRVAWLREAVVKPILRHVRSRRAAGRSADADSTATDKTSGESPRP